MDEGKQIYDWQRRDFRRQITEQLRLVRYGAHMNCRSSIREV